MRSIVVVLIVALASCSSPEHQATAVQDEAPRGVLRDTGWYPPILNQEIDFGKARSGSVITETGNEVLALGKRMSAGYQPVAGAVDAINFVVLGGEDKPGGAGRKIVHFTIKAEKLRQLAKSGATGKQVLDASTDVGSWSPSNDDVINEYCQADTPFCRAAREH